MKYFKLKITPVSPFGTLPMSDTLFGQLIWILGDMGEDISRLLENYTVNPFLVVSDFLPKNTGNSPKLPIKFNLEESKSDKIAKIIERKKIKLRNKISLDVIYNAQNINNNSIQEMSVALEKFVKNYEIVRCSINRLTGTTGNNFDPYSVIEFKYYEGSEFYFYFYATKEFDAEKVANAMKIMGQIGFGKDASLGKGQFKTDKLEEIEFDIADKNSIYTLGNAVLEGIEAENIYYEPFTRFGKHGNIRAVESSPFKNPIVMARQGALICFPDKELFDKPYIGKAIKGLSQYADTVHQGYSLYIPVHLEEK